MPLSLSSLLLELRNVKGEGPPTSSKYYARPIGDGYVLYYEVGPGNKPKSIPGTIGYHYDITYGTGGSSVSGKDYKLSPEQLAKAEEFVSLGIFKKTEEPNKYPDIEFRSSRSGSPGSAGLLWQSEKDVPPVSTAYYPKAAKWEFLLVDTDQKLVSLDASWGQGQARRGGSTPTKRVEKSYVMPSGDVAFTTNTLTLQKLFDHLMSVDPRVTADYKIISPDDKFEGKTIGGIADEPRATDVAVGGTPGKLIVYHGTSTNRWPEIQKKGMLPGKFEEAYNDQIKGYSEKNLYFTMDPHTAENYATRAAIWDKASALILQVEIPDITKIVPDEDSMGWFNLNREYTLKATPGQRDDYKAPWDRETGYPKVTYDREAWTIKGEQHPKNIFRFLTYANQTKAPGKTEAEAPEAGPEYVKDDEYYALLKDIEQKMAGFLTRSLRGETFAYKGWIPPKFVKKWKEYPRKPYPRAVDHGGGTGTEYEDTRQAVLKKVKRFDMNENGIRQIVREMLAEEAVGIPGYGMTGKEFEDRVGIKAVYDGRTGKVKPDEAKFVAQQLRMANPDRIVAYSRGAPVYNNAVADSEMAGIDVPVTFMAPSSYRKWSNAPVRRAAPGSVTMIGDKDKIVPYKQACRNAVDAGTPMYVLPGFSHTGILYSKAQVTPDSFEVDASACLADPEMPDWGPSRNGNDEEIAQQKERVRMHLKHEAALRNLIRGML